MTEVHDLLGIYGEVDHQVQEVPALAGEIAPLLGAYNTDIHGDHIAVGWFDRFVAWTAGYHGEERPPEPLRSPYPGLQSALEDLSEHSPSPHEATRRLLAITVAMRAFPNLLGPEQELADLVLGALSPSEGLAPGRSEAAKLQELLFGSFTSMSEWERVINEAVEEQLVPQYLRSQSGSPPCTGRLLPQPNPHDPNDPVPVTLLETSFDAADITFEAALDYLSPANWPTCSTLWKTMTKTADLPVPTSQASNPPGIAAIQDFDEVVSSDRDHIGDPGVWTVQTPLRFWFYRPDPDWAYLEYDLPPGHPVQGADIECDSGVLHLYRVGAGIHVYTSKFVRFEGSLDGATMAMVMCATGYSSGAQSVCFNCAAHSGQPSMHTYPLANPTSTAVLKNKPPMLTVDDDAEEATYTLTGTDTASSGSTLTVMKRTSAATTADGGTDDAADARKDMMDAVQACVTDSTKAYQESYAKLMAGKYKAEDWFTDVTRVWSLGVRDLSLWAKAARAWTPPMPGPAASGTSGTGGVTATPTGPTGATVQKVAKTTKKGPPKPDPGPKKGAKKAPKKGG